ncbi:hypothetical protein HMN09_00193600 [Mycena chlorophos]|uniref:C2 domain-containing protein n=1 Tax=Mycena chlorophos TaxID=658473 RepID=A0A8H6WKS8_MYCCL|nr:hypothetical protein HMN09_00193600 [Mycena chlorophos]
MDADLEAKFEKRASGEDATLDAVEETREKEMAPTTPTTPRGPPQMPATLAPDDPENPRKWSVPKKILVDVVLCVWVLTLTYSSTAYVASIPALQEKFNASLEVSILGVTLNVCVGLLRALCEATINDFLASVQAGPLLMAPLSELYGRQIVYRGAGLGYSAFAFGVAFAPNTAGLLVMRFFDGFFGSASINNVPASIGDFTTLTERMMYSSLYAAMAFGGPALGPLVSPFIETYAGYHWNLRVIAIFSTFLSLLVAFVPETSGPILLRRKLKREGKEVVEPSVSELVSTMKTAISRPLVYLFTEPVVMLVSVYLSVLYGILYGSVSREAYTFGGSLDVGLASATNLPMSRRSYRSGASVDRSSRYVSDDDLLNYVLRVAYLSYIMTPKPTETTTTPPAMDTRDREHHSRLSALSNFSIGDIFKDVRDGPKSVKFPEKLLKVLEQKLQSIAMGKDPAYSEQLVRRTMAKFYGQFMVDSFKRQMKENRKIEELILMFATHATGVLKKEPSLSGDGWKLELNNQIAIFVKMLRECLRSVNHVSPELLSRLDTYTAKLAPAQGTTATYSDSGYDSASTRNSISIPTVSANVNDMQLVQITAALFRIPESEVQKEVDALKGTCTAKAALTDLKTCLKNINAGVPFPGRKEDFETDEAWQHWRSNETSHLQQMVVAMVQFNPELAKSTPAESAAATSPYNARPSSSYSAYEHVARNPSIGSRRSLYVEEEGIQDEVNGDDEIPVGHYFTYIPSNPRKYYKRLLEHCLLTDLEIMLSPEVDDNDEVSLGILSAPHLDLLNEVALRWRIGHSYRATCFLDLVKQFYERQDIPMECIPDALTQISKVMSDVELDHWPVLDSEYLSGVYGGLFNTFLSNLYHAMDNVPTLKPSEVEPFVQVLEHIRDSGLLERFGFDQDINARLADIQTQVRQVALRWYGLKLKELQAAPGVNRALPLLLMTDEIEKAAKNLDKRFPEPILGQLDLVSLVMEVQIPAFVGEVQSSQKRLFESSMNGPTPDVPIQDIFALYRRTKLLLEMHHAFCPQGQIDFDIHAFFEPYVRQWLVNTDNKTGQWVEAAIKADKFQAEGPEGHSSSIVDLFESLKSPINFLQDLEWTDEYQEARFVTSLSKTMAKAIEQYCRSVEGLFLAEMFPRPNEFMQPQKSSAWLEKARQLAVTGEKKVEPFNFQPESCVKLNNVEAARKLLDNMYSQAQADKVSETLMQAPPLPSKTESEKFLFSVKICIAEGLVPLDSSPSSKLDTFVTLSDEAGMRLAKTRTIYETLSPRWDETFDISVDKPLWLMVSVRDRALVGKHDTVGRAYLCLDPKRFGDFLSHDLWMDLDSQGRVLVRISMEGEKDDILFYFGRAFRSLKRAESDMLRIFIDKMSPFIQQCISRSVLKALLKSDKPSLDVNKAISGVTALWGSAASALSSSSNEVQIPLPSSEKPRIRPEELTDVEIEQAISPLFDYFEANLQTLNTYLSDTAKEMVMSRVWKEILTVVEGLLIPPLSDISSDMKPLTDKEVDVVFKWLKFLRDYFYAGGEGPVPLEVLQNQKYRDVVSIRLYYDWHTDALMEECVRMMQQSLRSSTTTKRRVKSVYQQRNLGTIKERKKEKREEKDASNGETIMRILRMRPNTSDFIAQQLQILNTMQAEQEKRAQEKERKAKRQGGVGRPAPPPIPEIPPLPELPE